MTRPAKPARCSGKYGPTPEHLSFKVLKDQPEIDLRAGDTIYASPVKGLQGEPSRSLPLRVRDIRASRHTVRRFKPPTLTMSDGWRYNHREMTDFARTAHALNGISGKRLTYRRTSERPTA